MSLDTSAGIGPHRNALAAAAGLVALGALVLASGKSGPIGPETASIAVPGSSQSANPSGPETKVAMAATTPAIAPAASTPTAIAPGSTKLTPEMRSEFEAVIKDYLLKNPEVMVEVQQALEAKMEKIQSEKSAVALKSNAKEIFQPGVQPVAGNPNGDVTIVEFFDYNCGYCKKALPDVTALVTADKNVRFVLKEFPILTKGSEEASRVALAAKMQGKYWEFHLAMLNLQGQANEASALKVAEKIGLDMPRLKVDMASAAVKKEIEDTRALAQKMGINGTPHFLVGDKVIAGAPENLAEVLAGNVAEVRKEGGCKVCGG